MDMITNVIVGGVAVLHVFFLILEMFLWSKPTGLKVFGNSLERAKATAVLAANQGLYNGFLAAGLLWGLLASDTNHAQHIKIFFLGCVAVAGLYGGWSVTKKIVFVQAVPAIIGIILVASQ